MHILYLAFFLRIGIHSNISYYKLLLYDSRYETIQLIPLCGHGFGFHLSVSVDERNLECANRYLYTVDCRYSDSIYRSLRCVRYSRALDEGFGLPGLSQLAQYWIGSWRCTATGSERI